MLNIDASAQRHGVVDASAQRHGVVDVSAQRHGVDQLGLTCSTLLAWSCVMQ